MSRTTANGNGNELTARSLIESARTMTASPLLYVGAVTVVGAHEFVEWVPLSEPTETLALFPITLLLLYAQLTALAYYERKRYRRCRIADDQ